MNSLANIWNHPKTSVAGLLIAIVTVAGVLSQQGIDLGHAGSGTIVTLAGALATALLGLLAKDPGANDTDPEGTDPKGAGPSHQGLTNGSQSTTPPAAATAKLGVWALIALLLPPPFLAGCSGVTVAHDIVNWTPALQSAVATVDSTAALLAPADAPIFTAATVGFDAASNLLVAQAKAYLANPSAGTLAQIQTQVVTFQQQVNSALLQAAKIVDPASQKHALAAVQAVATIVGVLLSLVESISSKAAVAQMAAHSEIKLASVQPLLDSSQAARIVAAHYVEPINLAQVQVAQFEQTQHRAGF